MSSTAILILNWNGSADTINCLKALLPSITHEDYLFVIDNGSTDNSIEALKSYFATTQQSLLVSDETTLKTIFNPAQKKYLVCNSKNLGFGAGNNVVLKQLSLLDDKFELAWLLNNDAFLTEGALQSLKTSFTSDKQVAAAGSLILNYPDNGTIQCSGVKHYKFFGVSKLINKNKPYSELDKTAKIDFDYLNGASLMLRLSALETSGYFDERFFLYSEEVDLQLRLQENKYKLFLDLNSVVYHKLGGATSKSRYLFFYYYNSSAVFLSKKHFANYYTFCAIFNLIIISFIRSLPSIKNFKWSLKGILKGLRTS